MPEIRPLKDPTIEPTIFIFLVSFCEFGLPFEILEVDYNRRCGWSNDGLLPEA
jgi:hypothetical protein